MLVKREKVNKKQHLITDYMYNNDNVGIDLELLNEEKSNKIYNIPSVLISDESQNFNFAENEISLSANLKYESEKVQAIVNVTSPNDYYTVKKEIADNDFAQDIIDTCLENKKNIKNLPCYELAVQEVIDNIKEEALSNNYLIRENEMKYKCYIYSDNMELLGVASRLLYKSQGFFIIGEYIGKTLEKIASSNDKIIIHMCVGDNLVLQLINVRVEGCTSTNVSYVMINTANTKIKQIEETYMSTTMIMSNSIALPNYHPSNQILDYSEKFTSMNTRTEILNFYKMNKPNMTPTINVNKYLIG